MFSLETDEGWKGVNWKAHKSGASLIKQQGSINCKTVNGTAILQ